MEGLKAQIRDSIARWAGLRQTPDIKSIFSINLSENTVPVTEQNIAALAIANCTQLRTPGVDHAFYRYIKRNSQKDETLRLWIYGFLIQYFLCMRLRPSGFQIATIKDNAYKTVCFLINSLLPELRASGPKSTIDILNSGRVVWFVDLIRTYSAAKQTKQLNEAAISQTIGNDIVARDLFDLYFNGVVTPWTEELAELMIQRLVAN